MSPLELFVMCEQAIRRWEAGELIAEEPVIMLVIPRDNLPTGKGIRLFGRKGPTGLIATTKERPGGGYDVVAYFQAEQVKRCIQNLVG